MKKTPLLALTAMLFIGCASIERTSPGRMDKFDVIGGDTQAEQTVCVRNYGFGLLYIFTAICGDVSYNYEKHDIEGGFLLFRDRCNCSDCFRTLQAVAKDEGKIVTNVNMFNNSLPSQGVTGYVDYAGWCLESEDVGCSGVLRAKKKK